MLPAPLIGRGTCHLLFLLLAFACFPAFFPLVHAQVVTTIENTDPRLTYLPSVCDSTTSPNCNATWRILDLPGASGNSVTSTTGYSSLPPQLFFVVRGTSLTLRTSALSTASANLTLTASPSGVTLTTSFNASAGSISAINLPSAEDTTFALTYIAPGRLDIDVITVQAQDARLLSQPLHFPHRAPSPLSSSLVLHPPHLHLVLITQASHNPSAPSLVNLSPAFSVLFSSGLPCTSSLVGAVVGVAPCLPGPWKCADEKARQGNPILSPHPLQSHNHGWPVGPTNTLIPLVLISVTITTITALTLSSLASRVIPRDFEDFDFIAGRQSNDGYTNTKCTPHTWPAWSTLLSSFHRMLTISVVKHEA